MSADVDRIAREFYAIHRDKLPLPPTSTEIRDASLDEAYAMQEALHRLFILDRGEIAGYKIALTTPVMQQLMGVDQPCVGAMFSRLIHRSPASLRHQDYRRIAVECEIAVRLGEDLPARDRPYRREDLADAVEACLPAIELIEDHACDHYKEVGARALIANNAWNVGCILGEAVKNGSGLDLAEVTGALAINGQELGRGRGRDVLNGHPFHALAWVANVVAARGRPLRRGMVVLTGSVVATQFPRQGDTVTVSFDGLGKASVTFT